MELDDLISVRLSLAETEGITEVKSALIRFVSIDSQCHWGWIVTKKDENQIKSLCQLINLTPDVLFSAIKMNKGDFIGEDGTFLIDMVGSFFKYFRLYMGFKSNMEGSTCECEFFLISDSGFDVSEAGPYLSFETQIDSLLEDLSEIRDKIESRNLDLGFLDTCFVLLNSLGELRAMCTAYLMFFHPIQHLTTLANSFSFDTAEMARSRASEFLAQESKKLLNSFVSKYEEEYERLNW